MIKITLVNLVAVAIVVLIHYEALNLLAKIRVRSKAHHRLRILMDVFGVLLVHCFEIWIFACVYYGLMQFDGFGQLELLSGALITFADCVYYSFTTYTTLGYGDIVPLGGLRYLAGIESLTGLVLITWSASFLFLQMQRHWPEYEDTQ